MRKLPLYKLCVWLLAGSLFLAGCDKYDDVKPPRSGSCKIITLKGGLNTGDSLVIAYDKHDNPVSIIRDVVATGAPNWYFRYDKKGRMTDFYSVYHPTNPFFENWHRYQYDAKNRIIVDTSYAFGLIGPGIPLPDPELGQHSIANISTFTYDKENRIIKATDFYGLVYFETSHFIYNKKGNLEKIIRESEHGSTTETFTFDDKINLRRTHPAWQFLDRDYSANNYITVYSYNAPGLPEDVDFSNHVSRSTFANIPIAATTVTYACKSGR